jgi:catechol 2,3-dioxygenase-like lactoylglutathione lyase family enzyme
MSGWDKKIAAMTLFVGDLDRSRKFYQEVFGLSAVDADQDTVMFRFTNMFVFLHRSSAATNQPPAGEVLEQALQGAGQFAIIVDDVDAVRPDLDEAGVDLLSGPDDRPWGMRTMTFADPDGHVWEIAQELPGSEG